MNGLTPSLAPARPPDPPPPDAEGRPDQERPSGNCLESETKDTEAGGDSASAALRFDYRCEPRRRSEVPDVAPKLEALQRDLRTQVDAAQFDLPILLEAMGRCGLVRPRSEPRVLSAIVGVLAKMGARLDPVLLEFNASERRLAVLTALDRRTVRKALHALCDEDWLVLVDPHKGANARTYRVGSAWLRAALEEAARPCVSPMPHITASIASSSSEGSGPARGEDTPLQHESDSETSAVAVTWDIGETLASDAFRHGQVRRRGGVGESRRKALVAHEQYGPLKPRELQERTGLSRTTAWRARKDIERRGWTAPVGDAAALVPEAVARACEGHQRQDELRQRYSKERETYVEIVERQKQGEENARVLEAHREVRRVGVVSRRSAFDQAPQVETPSPATVPATQPVEIQQPPAATPDWAEIARRSAARSSLPDRKVPEPTMRSRTIAPVVDIAALRAWEEKHPDVTRNGARRAPDGRRRRSEQKPPTCKHGEPRDECGRCHYLDQLDGHPQSREIIAC